MVTEETRDDVWLKFLDVARLARYYAALSDKNKRARKLTQVFLLAFVTGAAASLMEIFPEWVGLLVSALLITLMIWDAVEDYAKKAAILSIISMECRKNEVAFSELWRDANKANSIEGEIRSRLNQLDSATLEATGKASYADVTENKELNEKCAKDAYISMEHQYVH